MGVGQGSGDGGSNQSCSGIKCECGPVPAKAIIVDVFWVSVVDDEADERKRHQDVTSEKGTVREGSRGQAPRARRCKPLAIFYLIHP